MKRHVTRPEVVPTKRKRMTPQRKLAIWTLQGGVCGCRNPECGRPVPVSGPDVIYDHEIMVEHGGADEWPNLRPVRKACDKPKTSGDLVRNGKTRRQRKKHNLSFERPKSKRPLKGRRKFGASRKLKGAGFKKGGQKARIPSRGFS